MDFISSKIQHFKASLTCGVGASVAYGLIMYFGVLWDARGPGALFSNSCPHVSVFIISSFVCTLMCLMQVLWYIVSFEAYKTKKWIWIGIVAASHLVASYLSLINTASGNATCIASIGSIFFLLILVSAFTTFVVKRIDLLSEKISL